MTSDEYATLMEFLATRFARIDARFDRIDARMDALWGRMDALDGRMVTIEGGLTRSEVLWESMRDDIHRVAEGVVALNERLDRFQTETNARFDDLGRRLGRIEVQFDRWTVDFGTVQLGHGARIEALERWRRGRDTEG